MKKMFRRIVGVMAGALLLGMMTGCKEAEPTTTAWVSEPTETEASTETTTEAEADDVTVRVGALSGPTAFGLVHLMKDAEDGNTVNTYEFADLATEATALVTPVAQGELDIAMVPANLSSVLYNKTEGGVCVLAVNTLGVLDIVERGETIKDWSDLSGKTIYATGEGAVPEYTLRYLLAKHDMDMDTDVNVQWCADTTEALSYITQTEGAVAMLPQPFVTVASTKVEDLRIAMDLNAAWEEVTDDAEAKTPITGVAIVRKDFLDEHPKAVETFMEEYEASLNAAMTDTDGTAALIGGYEIVPEPVAKKALPACHLTFENGETMKTHLSAYLQILADQNPQSVGGTLPEDDFYYIP